MEDCIFCRIIAGKIPASKVYEDKESFAFLDISPVSKGHTLVIPKKHAETMADVSLDVLAALSKTIQKVAKVLLKENEGVNVLQNNGRAAGQLVPHLHFHVVPRNSNDGVVIAHWKPIKYADNEMAQYQDKIKNLLNEVK